MRMIAFVLASSLASAGTISSGSLVLWQQGIGAAFPPNDYVSMRGNNLFLSNYFSPDLRSVDPSLYAHLCFGICPFTSSGLLTEDGYNYPTFVLNGVTYGQSSSNTRVSFALNFVGTPGTATALCLHPGDHASSCDTDWPIAAFTMSGTITVRDFDKNVILFTETVTGSGTSQSMSRWTYGDEFNSAGTIYTFSTPEPAAGTLVGVALIVALVIKQRHLHR